MPNEMQELWEEVSHSIHHWKSEYGCPLIWNIHFKVCPLLPYKLGKLVDL